MIEDSEVFYFTDEEVLDAVARMGFHVKDAGLLSSAVARPRASAFGQDAYPDIVTKAAALFESLVRNHALHDGNKRLSVAITFAFVSLNGGDLAYTEDEAYDFTIATASGELELDQIRDWFAAHVTPRT